MCLSDDLAGVVQAMHHSGSLGKRWGSVWQIGSLRKCEQREGRPSSIIVCDTLRETILIKKMLDNDSGVGAGGGDSCAGCTGFEQQHLCPHTHTTHSPFQAGSGATCGCERLHRAGGRRRGRKGGVKRSENGVVEDRTPFPRQT